MDGNHGELHPKTSDFVSSGIPFIMASDLKGGRVDTLSCKFILPEQAGTLRKGFAKTGDVLLSHKATIGRTALAGEIETDYLMLTPQVTYYRVLDETRLDRHYLKYYFDSRDFQEVFQSWAGAGSTRAYLGITAQLGLPVVVPPINVQRAIVDILGVLDCKIELNRQMNQTLEAMAQAIFKSWFVDFDPVTAKAEGRQPYGMNADTAALFPTRFAESELGPIPEGWEVSTIANIARYVNGKNFTKNATGSGRMVIRIAELNSGPGASTVYNEIEAKEDNTAYPGDLLFSWSGSLGVYRWHRDEALVNQHIFKVIPQEFPQWFVYYQLLEAISFFQGIAADKATTMGHIKREHLSQAKLALPPAGLMAAMDNVVEHIYQRIHQNDRESITLASIRDALLPKLLSGKIRVKDAGKQAEAVA